MTRCVILVPTIELGVQCIEVSIKLVGMFFSTSFVDNRLTLPRSLVLKSQETELRTRPDRVIATLHHSLMLKRYTTNSVR